MSLANVAWCAFAFCGAGALVKWRMKVFYTGFFTSLLLGLVASVAHGMGYAAPWLQPAMTTLGLAMSTFTLVNVWQFIGSACSGAVFTWLTLGADLGKWTS